MRTVAPVDGRLEDAMNSLLRCIGGFFAEFAKHMMNLRIFNHAVKFLSINAEHVDQAARCVLLGNWAPPFQGLYPPVHVYQ